jgi:hypothetical protein
LIASQTPQRKESSTKSFKLLAPLQATTMKKMSLFALQVVTKEKIIVGSLKLEEQAPCF